MEGRTSRSKMRSPREDEEQAREHLYKILVIGDFGVDLYNSEIYRKDIAGHERFGHMTRVYYKYAIGAIIVFDLTRQVTFDSVSKWLGDVNQKVLLENGDPVPVLVLANKCDVENQQVGPTQVEDFCSKYNLLGWFPTSAKEGTNISEAVEKLVTRVLELSNSEPDTQAEDMVDLGPTSESGGRFTPNTTTYSKTFSNGGTGESNGDSTGYSKVSNMRGLVGTVPISEPQRQSSCCS